MRNSLVVRTVAAAAVVGTLIAPARAGAAPPSASASVSPGAATEATLDRVRMLAVFDARWEVRSGARGALDAKGEAPDVFLAAGFNAAVLRAAEFERSNMVQIRTAIRTSRSGSAVRKASQRALVATHDEKEAFVQ